METTQDEPSAIRLAQALGISAHELSQLQYKVIDITASDIITAHDYHFSSSSPRHILDKINGLSPENTIQLGIYDLEKPAGDTGY